MADEWLWLYCMVPFSALLLNTHAWECVSILGPCCLLPRSVFEDGQDVFLRSRADVQPVKIARKAVERIGVVA